MTIAIGTDYKGLTHFIDREGVTKGCGSHIGLCGKEAMAGDAPADRAAVQCVRCLRAFDTGQHLVRGKVLAQLAAKKPTPPQ